MAIKDLVENGNGKPVQKQYVQVYVLQAVMCENCGTIIAPNGVIWNIDLAQLQTVGEKLHTDGIMSKKVICTTPKLLINYGQGLLSAELVK